MKISRIYLKNSQKSVKMEDNVKGNEREREILNILKCEDGYVSVKELCQRLYASESSIRRDLTKLEDKGVVTRTHGGAELVMNYSNIVAFNKRTQHNINEKRIIAKKAKTLIKDGNIVFLDQSSTSFYLASEIINNHTLTVITNNITIMNLLANSAIKTVSSGGMLSERNRNCLVGADARSVFENTYADIMFFSSKSISLDGIISDCDREEVVVRNSMLANAKEKVFLCDSEKFGTRSSYKQCGIWDIDCIVSENESAKQFSLLKENLKIL